MDLHGVEAVLTPHSRADLQWQPGAAWLGGGTWLFSEPQPGLRTLIDLAALGWPSLEPSSAGLRIAATCTIATLHDYPDGPPIFAQCCDALLGSFKVWNTATVGGNVCLALPASPMLALTVALDGVACIWTPDGGERHVPMAQFASGPLDTAVQPGEVLRAIDLPAAALRRRVAMRQISLTAMGRSAALLIAGRDGGAFQLTVTGSTKRPHRLDWAAPPDAATLDQAVAALPDWYDDVHGAPAWRRHVTRRLAAELLAELA